MRLALSLLLSIALQSCWAGYVPEREPKFATHTGKQRSSCEALDRLVLELAGDDLEASQMTGCGDSDGALFEWCRLLELSQENGRLRRWIAIAVMECAPNLDLDIEPESDQP